jgi:hypothetical protein
MPLDTWEATDRRFITENEKPLSVLVDHTVFSFPAELKFSTIPLAHFRPFHYRKRLLTLKITQNKSSAK